jgi:hypothetical protein
MLLLIDSKDRRKVQVRETKKGSPKAAFLIVMSEVISLL